MNTYTGLHQHSVYSVLDGYAKIDEIVLKCKELNMRGVCITDHGNMMAAYELNKACKKHDIKPIFGNETYIAPDSALIKEKVEGYKPAYHLILLAMNDVGYKNLMRLTSWSWINGKYYKPRVDFTRLHEFNEGLICTSACLGGLPSQFFMQNNPEEAEDAILKFKRIFGDRYYLELTHTGQCINGEYTQTTINNKLIEMAQKHNIQLVVTSDAHYVNEEDSDFHATLVDINTGGIHRKKKTNETIDEGGDGLYYEKGQYRIKTYDELMEHFVHYHGDEIIPIVAEALHNTNVIADRCNVKFKEGMKIIPKVCEDPDFVLRSTCESFLDKYLISKGIQSKREEYYNRLNYEISIISKMEFSDYFLVVSEYVQWAKDHGIMVGGGRGSAAGSLAAFCMRITGIDPVEYHLLFSRFLNRGRAKKPLVNFPEYTYEDYIKEKEQINATN